MTKFTIKKAYQVSAILKDGSRVWYDTDPNSGGYPYWSKFHSQKTFESLDKVPTFGPADYMRTSGGVIRIEILEVEITARVLQVEDLVSRTKAKAMAEIEAIQAELARKIALLEGSE